MKGMFTFILIIPVLSAVLVLADLWISVSSSSGSELRMRTAFYDREDLKGTFVQSIELSAEKCEGELKACIFEGMKRWEREAEAEFGTEIKAGFSDYAFNSSTRWENSGWDLGNEKTKDYFLVEENQSSVTVRFSGRELGGIFAITAVTEKNGIERLFMIGEGYFIEMKKEI